METPFITALVASRKDSKYLAKFIASYYATMPDRRRTELRVMVSEQDTWNKEIIQYFSGNSDIEFHYEDERLGRAGLHLYYEMMLNGQPLPDWTIYFCEDHHLNTPGWDRIIREQITRANLDPNKIWVLVPGWDNPGIGAMNHVVSRGFLEALGHIAKHGNLDSYINELIEGMPAGRVFHLPEIFHDFTHDTPSMMDDSRTKVELGPGAAAIPAWGTDEMRALIATDVAQLNKSIEGGR